MCGWNSTSLLLIFPVASKPVAVANKWFLLGAGSLQSRTMSKRYHLYKALLTRTSRLLKCHSKSQTVSCIARIKHSEICWELKWEAFKRACFLRGRGSTLLNVQTCLWKSRLHSLYLPILWQDFVNKVNLNGCLIVYSLHQLGTGF